MADSFNQPLSGNEMPRFGGIASMFRLPTQDSSDGLDVALIGVPLDYSFGLMAWPPGPRLLILSRLPIWVM